MSTTFGSIHGPVDLSDPKAEKRRKENRVIYTNPVVYVARTMTNRISFTGCIKSLWQLCRGYEVVGVMQ